MSNNNPILTEGRKKRVLIIYTGGTIGMIHPDNDPLKPLKPAGLNEIKEFIPVLKQLPIVIEYISLEPKDSAEMTSEDWLKIATTIKDNYNNFDGFVILHGTDTMTYTSSALSFMFQNLSKPVILTGSQLPLGKPRSDALQNLITSLMIAASTDGLKDIPIVPEVCIFFRDSLIRGNRAKKFSAKAYIGFNSPNYPLLGKVGEHIEIDEKNIRKLPGPNEIFYIEENIERNVISFSIFPGTSIDVLRSIFDIPGLKGVVLNTYGSGNAPTDVAFLETIRRAIRQKGVIIVNVTQCPEGIVEMGLYETSAKLMDQGVVSGLDMSTESALCKLSVLLGKQEKDVHLMMQINQKGEQSQSIYSVDFSSGETKDNIYNSSPKPIIGGLTKENIRTTIIRLSQVKLLSEPKNTEFTVKVFINYPNLQTTTPTDIIQFGGLKKERWTGDDNNPVNLLFDSTNTARNVINPNIPVRVGIVTDKQISWDRLNLLIYARVGNE